jgi:hypothetical protein
MIAAIRPTSWNWILLGHISSAMVLIAGLIIVVLVSVAAQRKALSEHVPLLRAIAFRSTLLLVIPPIILVHVFGALLGDREYPGDAAPGWLDTSFAVTTIATIVALVLLGLQFWVLRRTRAGHLTGWQASLATYLAPVLLAAMTVVLVLMAGKPSG